MSKALSRVEIWLAIILYVIGTIIAVAWAAMCSPFEDLEDPQK